MCCMQKLEKKMTNPPPMEIYPDVSSPKKKCEVSTFLWLSGNFSEAHIPRFHRQNTVSVWGEERNGQYKLMSTRNSQWQYERYTFSGFCQHATNIYWAIIMVITMLYAEVQSEQDRFNSPKPVKKKTKWVKEQIKKIKTSKCHYICYMGLP